MLTYAPVIVTLIIQEFELMDNLVKEYLPCESLKPFLELFWEGSFNINGSKETSVRIIPNGCLELIIHLNDQHCDLQSENAWSQTPDYMILGLFTRPYEVRFASQVNVFAIRFKPEGIYNVFGMAVSEIREQYEDMTLVFGGGFGDFCSRIKEEKNIAARISQTELYFLKSLGKRKIDMSYVNMAANLIRSSNTMKVEDLSRKLFISQRQLERQFKEKVGVSPKLYFRISRMNQVLRMLQSGGQLDLTQVAYKCGYFDQSHFINDFKSITGMKPSSFVRKQRAVISF